MATGKAGIFLLIFVKYSIGHLFAIYIHAIGIHAQRVHGIFIGYNAIAYQIADQ